MVRREGKVHYSAVSHFYFFKFCLEAKSFNRHQVICFHLTIPYNFVRLILSDSLCFVHILFGRMVKLNFLSLLTVDYHQHPGVTSLIPFFASLQYSLIVWFNVSLLLPFAILLIFIIIIIIIMFIHLEFFTTVLADGFSLEFEWQQIFSSLQDSSQYSGRSRQCCHLDSLYPSAKFQVLQAF